MKSRSEVIEEYSDALTSENGNIEAAEILYARMEYLFSSDFISEEIKIRCIAEEIDNIICASNISRYTEKGGASGC